MVYVHLNCTYYDYIINNNCHSHFILYGEASPVRFLPFFTNAVNWLSPSPPSTDGDSGDNGLEDYAISTVQLAKQVSDEY